jgi:hypothetical protein
LASTKDALATGEAFSPQKRTSSTSKHEISLLPGSATLTVETYLLTSPAKFVVSLEKLGIFDEGVLYFVCMKMSKRILQNLTFVLEQG